MGYNKGITQESACSCLHQNLNRLPTWLHENWVGTVLCLLTMSCPRISRISKSYSPCQRRQFRSYRGNWPSNWPLRLNVTLWKDLNLLTQLVLESGMHPSKKLYWFCNINTSSGNVKACILWASLADDTGIIFYLNLNEAFHLKCWVGDGFYHQVSRIIKLVHHHQRF